MTVGSGEWIVDRKAFGGTTVRQEDGTVARGLWRVEEASYGGSAEAGGILGVLCALCGSAREWQR
jgi:hypothetical protein